MTYITHRRFKAKAICGEVNIPAMTELDCTDGIISFMGYPICAAQSENAHQYFAVNDDGMGMERGKLTQAIQKTLAKRDTLYQDRWNKVWEDEVCQRFKRREHSDFWLWNDAFFNADIDTLKYIAKLIGLKI